MIGEIGSFYFNSKRQKAEAAVPSVVREVFFLHRQGKLAEAFELSNSISLADIHDDKLRSILIADRALLSVKIGLGMPDDIFVGVQNDRDGRCIIAYAEFTHYFWIDHKKAWRALFRLLINSPNSSSRYLMITGLFLVGHMLCIGGHNIIGFPLAKMAFKLCLRHRKRRGLSFATNIALATYPYTLFVSGRHEGLGNLLAELSSLIPDDPYYQTLFQISALYNHAYAGDIAQSELYAYRLNKLNEQGKLLRYMPLGKIMLFLPMALRGYGHLYSEEFNQIVSSHHPETTDNLINSQFYRAAALINLCLGRNDDALNAIRIGMDFRLRSHSFQAWSRIDNRIEYLAREIKAFNPAKEPILGLGKSEAPPILANTLIQIISILPKGLLDQYSFEDELTTILSEHFECENPEVVEDALTLSSRDPALKLGKRFVVFKNLDSQRRDYVWLMINAIAPSLAVLESSIAKTRDIMNRLNVAERESAIAKTTQMLAHDVRKPFSMIKMILDSLKNAKSLDDIRKTSEVGIPEIQHSMDTVNGLLHDIMEIGTNSPSLILEPATPESLINNVLRDTLSSLEETHVTIDYKLSHKMQVSVDIHKVMRLFANITGNALQAMRHQGRLWFNTEMVLENGIDFVEFTIGNSGSNIPDEDLDKLFDAFYTKGKKGGTGLGLAIAQKVVVAHGGRIWCQSSLQRGVEFHFTLPAAQGGVCTPVVDTLPRSSKEIVEMARRLFHLPGVTSVSLDFDESQLEEELLHILRSINTKVRILIVDDESVYRTVLLDYFRQREAIMNLLDVTAESSSATAFRSAAASAFDFAILDVDLGFQSINGFELTTQLRNAGHRGFICIHSNRISHTDYKEAIDHGADGFMPKPIGRTQLLKLLYQALRKRFAVDAGHEPAGESNAEPVIAAFSAMNFAFVDDSRLTLATWQHAWPLGQLTVFSSPGEFWQHVAENPGFLEDLSGLVTDYYFADGARQTGADFARDLRDRSPHLHIVLASNLEAEEGQADEGVFGGRLKKVIPTREAVMAAFKLSESTCQER